MVALLIASSFGLPVIGSCPPPALVASGLLRAYLRAFRRQTRRLLVTSMAARARLIAEGISASKIILWRPGVDTSMFAPTKRSGALRERWGVSDARPAVIYAGDRQTIAARSACCLWKRASPHAAHASADCRGDGPHRDELQARCPNAIFMGRVPRAEMPRVLASADLFVCPNESASANLAVLEAQASGLPVVVMERGSACERVSESSAGVCRSQADFVVETAALVRTGLRRSAIGLAAREYAYARSGPRASLRCTPSIARLRRCHAFGAISSHPSFRRADAFSSNSAIVASTCCQSRIKLVRVARSSCSRATQPEATWCSIVKVAYGPGLPVVLQKS